MEYVNKSVGMEVMEWEEMKRSGMVGEGRLWLRYVQRGTIFLS